jgi:rhodanese-related sulfurtransferase
MSGIEELHPAQALARIEAGALMIDVRESHERALGMAAPARGISRADLERDPAASLPDPDAEVVLICARGGRSMAVAQRLAGLGYRRLASVVGGTDAWRAAGLALTPAAADEDFLERYSRHLLLPQVGLE